MATSDCDWDCLSSGADNRIKPAYLPTYLLTAHVCILKCKLHVYFARDYFLYDMYQDSTRTISTEIPHQRKNTRLCLLCVLHAVLPGWWASRRRASSGWTLWCSRCSGRWAPAHWNLSFVWYIHSIDKTIFCFTTVPRSSVTQFVTIICSTHTRERARARAAPSIIFRGFEFWSSSSCICDMWNTCNFMFKTKHPPVAGSLPKRQEWHYVKRALAFLGETANQGEKSHKFKTMREGMVYIYIRMYECHRTFVDTEYR